MKRRYLEMPPPLPFVLWKPQANNSPPAKYLREVNFYLMSRSRWPLVGIIRVFSHWLARFCVLPFQVVKALSTHGPEVTRKFGVPMTTQARQIFRFAISVPLHPLHYYMYCLYDSESAESASHLIFRYQTKRRIYGLLGASQNKKTSPVSDKRAFAEHAATFKLPVTPVLATLEGGQWTIHGGEPNADIFVKPLAYRGGHGASRWNYTTRGTYAQHVNATASNREYNFPELLEHLRRTHVQYSGLILQPRVRNHTNLHQLAGDAVCTVRAVTILDECNQPELVNAVFRMPARIDSIVDNIHQGGLAAPIALHSGELGPARTLINPRLHSRHPISGQPIDGRTLPFWAAVVQLALQAHCAFLPRIIVGWDIAITPDGPLLIEANSQPCVDLIQIPGRQALGNTRFGALLKVQVERALGARLKGQSERISSPSSD